MKPAGVWGRTVVSVVLACGMMPGPVWAVTSTAQTSVTAQVTSRASLTLTRDLNSVTRFSASQLRFDRFDDQDGQTDGNAGFMYAPYRSETNKNWHIASIIANGTSMSLAASVSGSVGSTPMSDLLFVFTGGFFEPGATEPVAGTKTPTDTDPNTDDWEKLSTFSRTLNRSFTGTVPFNYRLKVAQAGAGTYTGTITYTLTSN